LIVAFSYYYYYSFIISCNILYHYIFCPCHYLIYIYSRPNTFISIYLILVPNFRLEIIFRIVTPFTCVCNIKIFHFNTSRYPVYFFLIFHQSFYHHLNLDKGMLVVLFSLRLSCRVKTSVPASFIMIGKTFQNDSYIQFYLSC